MNFTDKTKDAFVKPVVARLPSWLTANHISYARMLIVFPLLWLLVMNYRVVGLLVFLIASFSDAFDGAVARHRGQESVLGRILDPAADKILFFAAFIILGPELPKHLFIAIILTELITVFAALLFPVFMSLNKAVRKKPVIQATMAGKFKISAYYAGICVLFIVPFMPSAIHAANFIFQIGLVLSFVNFTQSLVAVRKN